MLNFLEIKIYRNFKMEKALRKTRICGIEDK